MKFLCDEMLKRLGRWLRAAGYDTVLEEDGAHDRRLIERAQREGRLLLTRDRKLTEYRGAPGTVVVLRGNSLDEWVAELRERLGIDWYHHPFTRCLVCNTPLGLADEALLREVPPTSRPLVDALYQCPGCGRLYWAGGHVRRMRERLQAWAADPVPPTQSRLTPKIGYPLQFSNSGQGQPLRNDSGSRGVRCSAKRWPLPVLTTRCGTRSRVRRAARRRTSS